MQDIACKRESAYLYQYFALPTRSSSCVLDDPQCQFGWLSLILSFECRLAMIVCGQGQGISFDLVDLRLNFYLLTWSSWKKANCAMHTHFRLSVWRNLANYRSTRKEFLGCDWQNYQVANVPVWLAKRRDVPTIGMSRGRWHCNIHGLSCKQGSS